MSATRYTATKDRIGFSRSSLTCLRSDNTVSGNAVFDLLQTVRINFDPCVNFDFFEITDSPAQSLKIRLLHVIPLLYDTSSQGRLALERRGYLRPSILSSQFRARPTRVVPGTTTARSHSIHQTSGNINVAYSNVIRKLVECMTTDLERS